MTWIDMAENWHVTLERLETRFPLLDCDAMPFPPVSITSLAQRLAVKHDLTPLEAREELTDWLFIKTLARQTNKPRLH
ncbi:MAG: hypothetical protein ACEPO2_00705 [Pelagibaca sp.]